MTPPAPHDFDDSFRPAPLSPDDVVDSLATAVVVLLNDLNIAYINPAAETLLGVSRARATGRPCAEFIAHDAELLGMARMALNSSTPYARNELPVKTNDGREHVLDCRVTTLGHHVLLELLDAGSRLRLNRETALLAQQSVGRTMGRQLAHEIRNPLAGLRGAAQLLQRQVGEPLGDHVRIIIEETDRLNDLVSTMLGPERPPQRAAVNVHEILHHVCELLRADAGDTVTIIEDYDPSLPPLQLDRDQAIQVMLNLGRNSIQALDGSGTLRMRTRAENSFMLRGRRHALVARIDFEDDGAGVPAELIETLFYPLVTGRADGTGLGLAIAQDLVSRHGGIVQLRNPVNPTLFSIYLPVQS